MKLGNIKYCKGTTRVAYLIGKYAIKVPRVGNWKMFLRGILANIDEHYWYKHSEDRAIMCPVLYKGIGGFFLIMERAEMILECNYDKADFQKRFGSFPLLDNKRENFGVLRGRIVLVDYADSRYLCSDCECLIKYFRPSIPYPKAM